MHARLRQHTLWYLSGSLALLVFLAACGGQPVPSPSTAPATPSSTDNNAEQECREDGGRWLAGTQICRTPRPSPSPTDQPSPTLNELDPADASIGIVELTMSMLESPGELEFVRDDELGGPPRWTATHIGGAEMMLVGQATDDPEFHLLTGMSLNLPLTSGAVDASGPLLQDFLFAADLATDNEAGAWFRDTFAECAVASCSASREIVIEESLGRSEEIAMSIEASAGDGVTFAVAVVP